MMKIQWKYIGFLAALLMLYLVLLYTMPRKFNWTVTLYKNDKNPFGALVLKNLLEKSWFESLSYSNRTIYEMQGVQEENLFILSQSFGTTRSEMGMLLNMAREGKTIFISTHETDSLFADSLGVVFNQFSFEFILNSVWGGDSTGVRFVHPAYDTTQIYWMPSKLLPQYFNRFDHELWQVLAVNSDDQPVLLKRQVGQGSVVLSSTPLMFSNFGLLKNNNDTFAAGALSLCSPWDIHWAEFYQLGRMESQTPLRYILSEPALKWAFYIAFITLILMMIVDAKRRQRIIPVMEQPKNDTLDFVKTIARLYYNKGDHKALALRQMLHFTDYLKFHLRINVNEGVAENIPRIAAKTGKTEKDVKKLFDKFNAINNSLYVTSRELREFSAMIDGIMMNRTT